MNDSRQTEKAGWIRRLLDARVIQTLAIYIPVAWLTIEIFTAVTTQFGLPAWLPGLAMVLFIAGIPVVAFLAWAFQVTPEGIRTEVRSTRGGLVIAIAMAVLLGTGAILLQRLQPPQPEIDSASLATYGSVNTKPVTAVTVFDFEGPGEEQLGRIFAAEVSDRLARHADLYVTAPNSLDSVQLAGLSFATRQEVLLTDHSVRGVIEDEGETLRLQINLVDATQNVVWQDDYSFGRGLESQKGVQRRVAQDLAGQLGTRTPTAEYCEPTTDIEALEAYHAARLLLNQRGPENLAEAERQLKLAIELDPNYGRAYSALGTAIMLQRKRGAMELTGDLARMALDLCPTLAAAYKFWVPPYEGITNFAIDQELQWQDALAMEPNHLFLLDNYSGWLERMGRMNEARSTAERAYRNNPLDARAVVGYGWTTSYVGDLDRALRLADRAEELGDKSCNTPLLRLHVVTKDGSSPDRVRQVYEQTPKRCLGMLLHGWDDYNAEELITDLSAAKSDPAARRRILDFLEARLEDNPNVAMVWGIELGAPDLAHRAFKYGRENDSYIHQVAWWMPTEGARLFRRDPRFAETMNEWEMDDYWREFGWPSAGMCAPLGGGFVCDN